MEEIVTSPKIEQENFDFFFTLGVGQQKYAHKNPEKNNNTHDRVFYVGSQKRAFVVRIFAFGPSRQ